MTIPVVADADALFQATTRGLLIFLDYQGLIKLHWSPLILDEVSRALVDSGRKNTLDDAKAHEARMCDALPNAQVSVADVHSAFEAVASAVRSAKDIHVAACAHYLIAARAYPNALPIALVTRNIKDFKKDALAGLGIVLMRPDDFLDGLTSVQSTDVARAFRSFRLDLSSQPDPEALLIRLKRDGLGKTVRRLRALEQAGQVAL